MQKTHETDAALHALLDAFMDEDKNLILARLAELQMRTKCGECPAVAFNAANSYYPEDCYTIGD